MSKRQLLATTHSPDIVVIGLIEDGHIAEVEDHIPGVAGKVVVGSRRPVVVGLRIWEIGRVYCRVINTIIVD